MGDLLFHCFDHESYNQYVKPYDKYIFLRNNVNNEILSGRLFKACSEIAHSNLKIQSVSKYILIIADGQRFILIYYFLFKKQDKPV